MSALAPYFDGAFAKVFGTATQVSGGDNFNMARAQSILTGELIGGVCPPLTPRQARDVIAWATRSPSPSATAYPSLPVAGGLDSYAQEMREGFKFKYGS